MSTSLLYHGWGVRGYEHAATTFLEGTIRFSIEQRSETFRCSNCGSDQVMTAGRVPREFRSLPIGGKPVWIALSIPRLWCSACGKTRQAKVAFVVSAKNPSKWPALFEFRAALATVGDGAEVRITLPDGRTVLSTDAGVDDLLSKIVGRAVNLISSAPQAAKLEEYWPDMEELPNRDVVTDESLPAGTFFDCATVHLLTTSTLDALRTLYPQGRFEPRRFRPNLIVATPDIAGFAENAWVGRTIQFGSQVRLKITGPCPRCVMTTLALDDLPKDPLVLKTAARHNGAHVGVYASVLTGGLVHRNDSVVLQ